MTLNHTVPAGSTEQWNDGKRYLWLLGLVVPSLAFIAWGMHALTGWGVWFWIGPIVVFGGGAGDRPGRRPRPQQPARRRDRGAGERPLLPLDHLPLPADPVRRLRRRLLAVRAPATCRWSTGRPRVSIGCIGGIGINTAHELGHKRESHERWLAKIALAQSFYGHFYIEHNRGHHVRVATPEDPASSPGRRELLRRSCRAPSLGSLRSAWRLEKRRDRPPAAAPVRIRNDVLNAWLMSVVLWGALMRRLRLAGSCRSC